MKLKIDNELKYLIPPLEDDEFKQLENNILNEGYRKNEPIVLWKEKGVIVDGHNRNTICDKHKIKPTTFEKSFPDKNSVILWMIDNQMGRRNISTYARTRLLLKKDSIINPIKEKAKEKQREAGGAVCQKSDKAVVDTKKEIAKLAKTSHDTVAKVRFIEEKADEETKKKLIAGNKYLSINKVYTDLKKKENREKIVEEFKNAPQLEKEDKKYKIIYADPPWKYFTSGNKNQSQHYKPMEMDEIKNLPINKLADDNCILFLWVTFPILREAFEVLDSWGFSYSTCGFTWVKKTKTGKRWFFGLGQWTRSNAELCLIATKGKPVRQSASVSQIIDTPIEAHSKKPDIVRDKIVELVGDLPRIELFARTKPKGWDVWGNE